MMQSKMTKLALAMGLGLGGLALVPATQAMNLATDGLGQVLIFPYYTVQGGWTTLFNITNTSSRYVALKVRFHESYNSRGVFDFNVVMSPYDVWNGWVERSGSGDASFPIFRTEDTSCATFANLTAFTPTAGIPFYAPNANIDGTLAYTDSGASIAADGGPTAPSRMNEGYMEVIMMGATGTDFVVDPQDLASVLVGGAKHVNGEAPTGCGALADAFMEYPGTATSGFEALQSQFDSYDGVNPLKGSYNLVNAAKGWTASGSPTTIANFSTAVLLTTALAPTTTDEPPFALSFLEPSLNSGNTAPVGTSEVDGALSTSTNAVDGGVNAVSGLLARTNVINQWSRITQNSNGWVTATDWVLTFPTKAFYVDNWQTSIESARTVERATVVPPTIPVAVPTDYPTPFTSVFDNSQVTPKVKNGQSCFATPFSIYDREEKKQQGTGLSPGNSNALCYESNVLTFGTPGLVATNILSSATAKGVNTLPGDSGYMNVGLAAADTLNVSQGLPVIGFMITSRDTGDGTLNEAFLVDHAYLRVVPDLAR